MILYYMHVVYGGVYFMTRFQSLSDSEMEIMKVIWEMAGPVTTSQLLELFAYKGWKVQTLSTFLTRLTEKGVLRAEKWGKNKLYSPALTQADYHKQEAKYVIDSMYHGSLLDFLAAFYGGQGISKTELEELKHWFEQEAQHD